MNVIITGSAGLIGSACVDLWAGRGHRVSGVDCDGRKEFFGHAGTIEPNLQRLQERHRDQYRHFQVDIRNRKEITTIVKTVRPSVILHCAGQPSHDYSKKFPAVDWDVNATGTLNLLEATRLHAPEAMFIFTSTNKVYGDAPNRLEYQALGDRWVPRSDSSVAGLTNFGFTEDFLDGGLGPCTRTVFGTSKLAADLMVQEYARYFGMRTAVFRLGCVTGADHAAVELHGFLAYLARCVSGGSLYNVFGYGGRQVRDNLHAKDVASAFAVLVERDVDAGTYVYNMGGGVERSVSILGAHKMLCELLGKKHTLTYDRKPREADHKWWVTDIGKFQAEHPGWAPSVSLEYILQDVAGL